MLWYFTDHRFVSHGGIVYDRFGFDARYFRGYLAPSLHQIRLVCRAQPVDIQPSLSVTSFDGLTAVTLPNDNALRWLIRASLASFRLGATMPRGDTAVLRIPSVLGLLTGTLLALRGIPYVAEVVGEPREAVQHDVRWTGAGFLALMVEPLMRWVVRRARSVSYVSEALRTRFPEGTGASTGILSSIRLDDAAIGNARTYAGPLPATARVICIASLYPRKGHRVLLEAFKRFHRVHPWSTLTLIGDGPEREALAEAANTAGLGADVVFRGHLSSSGEIFRALDASDLFVLASLTEGLPRVVIEAQARGVPVVATDAGGTRELLAPAQVARVGDASDLADRMLRLAGSAELLTEASAAGISRAAQFGLTRQSAIRQQLIRTAAEAPR